MLIEDLIGFTDHHIPLRILHIVYLTFSIEPSSCFHVKLLVLFLINGSKYNKWLFSYLVFLIYACSTFHTILVPFSNIFDYESDMFSTSQMIVTISSPFSFTFFINGVIIKFVFCYFKLLLCKKNISILYHSLLVTMRLLSWKVIRDLCCWKLPCKCSGRVSIDKLLILGIVICGRLVVGGSATFLKRASFLTGC